MSRKTPGREKSENRLLLRLPLTEARQSGRTLVIDDWNNTLVDRCLLGLSLIAALTGILWISTSAIGDDFRNFTILTWLTCIPAAGFWLLGIGLFCLAVGKNRIVVDHMRLTIRTFRIVPCWRRVIPIEEIRQIRIQRDGSSPDAWRVYLKPAGKPITIGAAMLRQEAEGLGRLLKYYTPNAVEPDVPAPADRCGDLSKAKQHLPPALVTEMPRESTFYLQDGKHDSVRFVNCGEPSGGAPLLLLAVNMSFGIFLPLVVDSLAREIASPGNVVFDIFAALIVVGVVLVILTAAFFAFLASLLEPHRETVLEFRADELVRSTSWLGFHRRRVWPINAQSRFRVGREALTKAGRRGHYFPRYWLGLFDHDQNRMIFRQSALGFAEAQWMATILTNQYPDLSTTRGAPRKLPGKAAN